MQGSSQCWKRTLSQGYRSTGVQCDPLVGTGRTDTMGVCTQRSRPRAGWWVVSCAKFVLRQRARLDTLCEIHNARLEAIGSLQHSLGDCCRLSNHKSSTSVTKRQCHYGQLSAI
eukprot:1810187-Amphidinium_carterae.1